jgi:hypothetical protein
MKYISGFGWNEAKQTVTTPDEVRIAPIASNSKYAKY